MMKYYAMIFGSFFFWTKANYEAMFFAALAGLILVWLDWATEKGKI